MGSEQKTNKKKVKDECKGDEVEESEDEKDLIPAEEQTEEFFIIRNDDVFSQNEESLEIKDDEEIIEIKEDPIKVIEIKEDPIKIIEIKEDPIDVIEIKEDPCIKTHQVITNLSVTTGEELSTEKTVEPMALTTKKSKKSVVTVESEEEL